MLAAAKHDSAKILAQPGIGPVVAITGLIDRLFVIVGIVLPLLQ